MIPTLGVTIMAVMTRKQGKKTPPARGPSSSSSLDEFKDTIKGLIKEKTKTSNNSVNDTSNTLDTPKKGF
jgi:hypothetical protein